MIQTSCTLYVAQFERNMKANSLYYSKSERMKEQKEDVINKTRH